MRSWRLAMLGDGFAVTDASDANDPILARVLCWGRPTYTLFDCAQ